jgi:hypothetical protein
MILANLGTILVYWSIAGLVFGAVGGALPDGAPKRVLCALAHLSPGDIFGAVRAARAPVEPSK